MVSPMGQVFSDSKCGCLLVFPLPPTIEQRSNLRVPRETEVTQAFPDSSRIARESQ